MPFESPFALQHLQIQELVLRGVDTVHQIVGVHDRVNMALRDGRLKRRQVELAETALVHFGIRVVTAVLLVVGREVFTVAITPRDCTPSMKGTTRPELRNGSSERYSKLRPDTGERAIFTPGPRRKFTPRTRASLPRLSPSLRAKSGSQVAASAAPPA